MTKHTYFRANDGTLFIPEPLDAVALMCCNNAMAYDACLEHDRQTLPDIYKAKITEVGLSLRAVHGLRRVGVETIADICKIRKKDFARTRNVGAGTVAEVDDFLHSHNIDWN